MKCVRIFPGKLRGSIKVLPSKSISHRALICAGLSNGVSNIKNIIFSQDIKATCNAMECFGAQMKIKDDSIAVEGSHGINIINSNIDSYESGSTLRFLIPMAAASGEKVTFSGRGKLIERPLEPYYEIFREKNIKYENDNGKLPLTLKGSLSPGEFMLKGNISSQFITGLLFALPLLHGDSSITVTTELESKPYIDLTLMVLKKFGIDIQHDDFYRKFYIKGNQVYEPSDYEVEGDFSQAAFWLTAGALGSDVECCGLNLNSLQGDKRILETIKDMRGKLSVDGDKIKACSRGTEGIAFDGSECPDLVPIVAVLAALSKGTTHIVNAGRLRIKESDRLTAITTGLNKIGADVEEREDGLIIRGKDMLYGGEADSFNDHRIAMALAIASTRCINPVTIKDSGCIKKSYPDFWDHFRKLGGRIDEWSMGE